MYSKLKQLRRFGLGSSILAFALATMLLIGCQPGSQTPTPTQTAVPRPPTNEPLLHVPGTFGGSANSTSSLHIEPTFSCGPTMLYDTQSLPNVLLWSPDGSHVLFSEGGTIWSVDVQGARLQRVLHALGGTTPVGFLDFAFGFHADVSPDGTQLAYTSCQFPAEYEDAQFAQAEIAQYGPEWYERSMYSYEIALSSLEDGNQQRLTHSRTLDEHYPAWSPTGDRIAFIGARLYTMLPDGSDVQSVTAKDMTIELVPPAWSPDGQRLAFVGYEEEFNTLGARRFAYTVRPDGSELFQAGELGSVGPSRPGELVVAPTWSPNGERLAFQGFKGEDLAIYTVRFDGSELRLVWHSEEGAGPSEVSQVSWSPDGSELLIVGTGTAGAGVYIVNLDDGSLRPLQRGGRFKMAAWSPDGSEVAIYSADTRWSSVRKLSSFSLYTITRDGTGTRDLVYMNEYGRFRAVQPTQSAATEEPATRSPTLMPAEPTSTPVE